MNSKKQVTIIGLGYLGLLWQRICQKNKVIRFDIGEMGVSELNQPEDRTNEANLDNLKLVFGCAQIQAQVYA